jgi:hypothetical protein
MAHFELLFLAPDPYPSYLLHLPIAFFLYFLWELVPFNVVKLVAIFWSFHLFFRPVCVLNFYLICPKMYIIILIAKVLIG